MEEVSFARAREEMVREQIADRGVRDKLVLDAMLAVPREKFVPEYLQKVAYADEPLPIGHSQTISQPFIVAFMTEVLRLTKDSRALEIGTGSGYQSAILASIAKEVYTIEIVKPLYEYAHGILHGLGYGNIRTKLGDGYKGWPEFAPFDAIILTAAPSEVPAELVHQLGPRGRMVAPVGSFSQELYLIERGEKGFTQTELLPVRFVPMVRDLSKL